MKRRTVLGGLLGAGGAVAARAMLGETLATALDVATPGASPYGPLLAPNADGLALPAGFSSRVVAQSGLAVTNTNHVWHAAPDGGACFGKNDGGWVYVSNSEVSNGGGGVGAISFASTGEPNAAYPILSGTNRNCAGGKMSWGRWLSCEENGSSGYVYECNPYGGAPGVIRPALGRFNHEGAALDRATGQIYLTEDHPSGRLYRFTPDVPNDLSAGLLEAASVSGGVVSWVEVSPLVPARGADSTAFDGGEGIWIDRGVAYFTTKGDNRVWALELGTQALTILYDFAARPDNPLSGVDNIVAHAPSGDLYVAEDGGNMEICIIGQVGTTTNVAPFLRIDGHPGSEVTGPAFSPDGTRLYFSSQRGPAGDGITYEVTGPFRAEPPEVDALSPNAPEGVSATASGSTVTVTWDAATDRPNPGGVGVAGYWVVRDWVTQWRVPADGPLLFEDLGVTPGRHRYQVFAVDAGNLISDGSLPAIVEVSSPDTEAPSPPPNVTATVLNGDVTVAWDPASDLPEVGGVGVGAYWVVRDWVTQWRVAADGPLVFVDENPPVGQRRYQVHAVDRGNRISGPSATVRVTV